MPDESIFKYAECAITKRITVVLSHNSQVCFKVDDLMEPLVQYKFTVLRI